MKILAIETSCDETACAIIEDGTKIVSSVVASSTDMHKKYGGIVPEVAAREQLKCIIPVIEEALSIYSSSDESLRSREVGSDSSLPIESGSNNMKNMIDKHIDAIAVTVGPGLIGSLLVGVETAKTIAFVTSKPIIPVNHVLAHVYANFVDVIPSEVEGSLAGRQTSQPRLTVANASSNKLRDSSSTNRRTQNDKGVQFPAISLVVSGGHTELYLMTSMKNLTWLGGTLDDAAGECFDKSARLLGFGGGGGAAIQESANKYNPPYSSSEASSTNREVPNNSSRLRSNNIQLPRPMMKDKSLNFSFSGLKTAIARAWNKVNPHVMLNSFQHPNKIPKHIRDDVINALAFEVQEAITDVLVEKTLRAAEIHSAKSILLSGGVAANTRLCEKFQSAVSPPTGEAGNQLSARLPARQAINFFFPPKELCTDNAVCIGSCAFFRSKPTNWHEITAVPDLSVEV